MATVYRATAPSGNLVALKVLSRHLTSDATARRRFELESRLHLNHPAVVRVLDYGILDGTPYLVTEYVVGESLEQLLERSGTLSPLRVVPILSDIASALDYAHAHGTIHRDVKPSNILLRVDGQAMLADFGIAKSADRTSYTATSARVGSARYMSPEQAQGVLVLTHSSDIYSLGVTAYHALCGRCPFEADNDIAIARMHIDEKPRHVCDVNPQVPRAIGTVVMQALEKQPRRRWYSAGQFARAFERAVARSTARNQLWRRPGGRVRLMTVVTVAGIIPLFAAMTVVVMMTRSSVVGNHLTPTEWPTARSIPLQQAITTTGLISPVTKLITPTVNGTWVLTRTPDRAPALNQSTAAPPGTTSMATPSAIETTAPLSYTP